VKIFLKDPDATADFGIEISKLISDSSNDVIEIHLVGELGAGKTFLTKSILNSLGWHGIVKSPTYTLCDEYETEDMLFLHVDLYRLSDSSEIQILELDRPSEKIKVIIIEWPEIIGDSRGFDLKVSLSYRDQGREALLENKLINK
jgi:ATPase, YjeE family